MPPAGAVDKSFSNIEKRERGEGQWPETNLMESTEIVQTVINMFTTSP